MVGEDRHKLALPRRILAIVLSALFAVLGVVGFRQTQDPLQLMLFIALAAISWGVVHLLFLGIEKLLDSLDQR